jgi:thiamine biosynthesis lipoprotein
MKAWGLYTGQGQEAGREFLRAWRSRPGVNGVEVDVANRRLRRWDRRIEVDLGGIGKGIAVDEALAVLRAAGSRAALVNLGGSIGVLGAPGENPGGWPVGIADPARPGELCAELPLASGHVATSGNYERWVETPAGRRHHILDPLTGEPGPGIASLTVRSATGVEADVLSTARFIDASRGRDLSSDPEVLHRV